MRIGTAADWKTVAAGSSHTLAVKTDGTLWTWGNNGNGQLGDGSIGMRFSPVRIGAEANWQSVAAGAVHTVAVKRTTGKLWAWGRNNYGQLGDGTVTDRKSPVQIGSFLAANVATGSSHTVAVKPDGTLWTWGNNGNGQLGDGTTANKSRPVRISSIGITANWKSVTAGGYHSVALNLGKMLWACGSNGYGQLGDGTTTQRNSPVLVGTAPGF